MTAKPDYESIMQVDDPDFISTKDFTITAKRCGEDPNAKYIIMKEELILCRVYYEEIANHNFAQPGEISEDGVILPKKDTFVYAVNSSRLKQQNPNLVVEPFTVNLLGVLPEYKLFATRNNAWEYVKFNQPQFSRHTLLSFFDSLNTSVEAADEMRAQFDKFQRGIIINDTKDKSLSEAF